MKPENHVHAAREMLLTYKLGDVKESLPGTVGKSIGQDKYLRLFSQRGPFTAPSVCLSRAKASAFTKKSTCAFYLIVQINVCLRLS
ncbi:hypothetical protein [Pontibacter mangrovi]|uniref:Uncharacterized protein n=1 Tax=Pontibacter mangrovi TaxID=2589816 RepID=A0A501W2X0_9BACT|nr:hypothetical protein [Pontibacter mangrovi]TPE43102.1 hypothetical protein FJM65_15805 [Pontibacter mangrovi]